MIQMALSALEELWRVTNLDKKYKRVTDMKNSNDLRLHQSACDVFVEVYGIVDLHCSALPMREEVELYFNACLCAVIVFSVMNS
jgi:hypothetical protein